MRHGTLSSVSNSQVFLKDFPTCLKLLKFLIILFEKLSLGKKYAERENLIFYIAFEQVAEKAWESLHLTHSTDFNLMLIIAYR